MYMYGGEQGQDNVEQHIVSDRMEELEKQIGKQLKRIENLENSIREIKKFDTVAVNLYKDKTVQAALIKAMLKNGIGKELVGMVG